MKAVTVPEAITETVTVPEVTVDTEAVTTPEATIETVVVPEATMEADALTKLAGECCSILLPVMHYINS